MTAPDRGATALDLTADPAELTATLVDAPSVSGSEGPLADAVERSLRALPHLKAVRDGDAVVAFTNLGRTRRVILAGHLDTVPIVDNVPSRQDGDFVVELMKPVYEPGKFAGWIAPPKVGIDNKSGDFEYVKLAA